MYDTIGSEQVKCFHCDLIHYNLNDIVPCEKFNYSKNLLIIPFDTSLNDFWHSLNFIIIKDSKVYQLKPITDLKESDFNYIEDVITYTGEKVNIFNLNDLINYIEDIMILKVKDDINDLKNTYIDNYEPFAKKWFLK